MDRVGGDRPMEAGATLKEAGLLLRKVPVAPLRPVLANLQEVFLGTKLAVAAQCVHLDKVFADKAVAAVGRDKVGGAFTERVRRFLPVVGTATASLAVTGLAAGTATPAVSFALLTLLLVGLSLVTIAVSQLG